MSDIEPHPTSLEDISSGLLTGAMVTLLGVAAGTVLTWQLIAGFSGWLPDLRDITADLPPRSSHTSASDILIGVMALFTTGASTLFGLGIVRKNLGLLRDRKRLKTSSSRL